MKRFVCVLAVVALLVEANSVAQAATISVESGTSSFAVSNTDIGETSATVSGHATWNGGAPAGSIVNLNSRGNAPDEATLAGNGSLELGTGAGVGFEPNNGNYVTYTFDLTNAPLGWDINEITSYASWGGRARQEYAVEATLVDGTWVSVLPTTVYFAGGSDASKVDISNLGLTGIKTLSVNNFGYGPDGPVGAAGNIYHEIDVFGTATVPEPGTIVLLVTGLIGLLAYAWRKRK